MSILRFNTDNLWNRILTKFNNSSDYERLYCSILIHCHLEINDYGVKIDKLIGGYTEFTATSSIHIYSYPSNIHIEITKVIKNLLMLEKKRQEKIIL